MSGEIITIIVSALVAAIATPVGAWVGSRLMRAKYQAEVDQLRAEMKDKLAEVKSHELENVRKASDILMESIVPPLQAEINNLRNDVQRLNKALERIWGCPHVDRCLSNTSCCSSRKAVRQSRTEATEALTATGHTESRNEEKRETTRTEKTEGVTETEIEIYDTTQPKDPERDCRR